MGKHLVDDLAIALGDDPVPRKQALKVVGAAAIAALVPALVPRRADAGRAKRRCRKKGGVFVSRGTCKCALTCASDVNQFSCQDNFSCACWLTADGRGFCGIKSTTPTGCSSDSECPPNTTCVVVPFCEGSGTGCSSAATCTSVQGCINGQCQVTGCATACS